ncbi:MAG: hypothetical protein AB7P53_14055 [Candidatus Dadabacteria bacterium]
MNKEYRERPARKVYRARPDYRDRKDLKGFREFKAFRGNPGRRGRKDLKVFRVYKVSRGWLGRKAIRGRRGLTVRTERMDLRVSLILPRNLSV